MAVHQNCNPLRSMQSGELGVRGTPSAHRARGELSFAPAPVLQAAEKHWCQAYTESMGVRPTQLTENRKNRLAKLFRILTCQMCRSDTHALLPVAIFSGMIW